MSASKRPEKLDPDLLDNFGTLGLNERASIVEGHHSFVKTLTKLARLTADILRLQKEAAEVKFAIRIKQTLRCFANFSFVKSEPILAFPRFSSLDEVVAGHPVPELYDCE
jgi:hypothetical protein